MMIRYWQPTTDLDPIRHHLDQLFSDLTRVGQSTPIWKPDIALVDRGDAFVLRSLLPGVSADDLDIQVTQKAVSIQGKRSAPTPAEGETLLYSDITDGSFQRLVHLPAAVHNDQVQAEFTDGILNLVLPKVVDEAKKVVKVSLSQPTS
jgi:HSP20 family protein